MQHYHSGRSDTAQWFQSSPVPEDGCNAAHRTGCATRQGFNPHPSRRTGATRIRQGNTIGTTLFQSSPVPEDGCNLLVHGYFTNSGSQFQSSPVPEDGCNHRRILVGICVRRFNPHPSRRTGATMFCMYCGRSMSPVSILTRPGGRVQPPRQECATYCCAPVSILTRPGGRVQLYDRIAAESPLRGFNPHPSRRTGATRGLT